MTRSERELYRQWYVGLCAAHIAHQQAAVHCQRRHVRLGIPVIVLTTLVGTTAFSTLQTESPPDWLQFGLGLVSVTAAVLASLQTFLNLGEQAEKHKSAAGRYGSLRRRFEQLITQAPEDFRDNADTIRTEWDELDASTPNVSEAIYRGAIDPARQRAADLFQAGSIDAAEPANE